MVKPAPVDFIESFVGGADYWANAIRKEFRTTDPAQMAFVDTYKVTFYLCSVLCDKENVLIVFFMSLLGSSREPHGVCESAPHCRVVVEPQGWGCICLLRRSSSARRHQQARSCYHYHVLGWRCSQSRPVLCSEQGGGRDIRPKEGDERHADLACGVQARWVVNVLILWLSLDINCVVVMVVRVGEGGAAAAPAPVKKAPVAAAPKVTESLVLLR